MLLALSISRDNTLGHLLCGFLVKAFGLVDKRQFLLLFFWDRSQFLSLDLDLAHIQFARALHREPLPNGHRKRAGERTSQASEQDGMPGQVSSGHAHHQAEIGGKTIAGSQHCCPQGIATAGTAVTPLEACQDGSSNTALSRCLHRTKEACMGTFISRQTSRARFWLRIILATRIALHC